MPSRARRKRTADKNSISHATLKNNNKSLKTRRKTMFEAAFEKGGDDLLSFDSRVIRTPEACDHG
jgi:hypothetical protein